MGEWSPSEVSVFAKSDQFGQFIGPLRVWRKFEQIPGLMMTRSFGDERAHTCGVISTPEIRNFSLNASTKAVVLGSDGMWEVITQERIKQVVMKHYKGKKSDDAAAELLELSLEGWARKVDSTVT